MDHRRTTRWLLVVLLVTFVAYAPSLANGFAMDDRDVAKAFLDDGKPNWLVYELQPLGVYFSTHFWSGKGRRASLLFRPVTILSFALTYKTLGSLFGDGEVARGGTSQGELAEAWPQHAVNILLHLLAVWLVYRLFRLIVARGPALAAATLFALHAIHSEVVASVIGRAELLAFVNGAGALLLYERGVAKTRAPSERGVSGGRARLLRWCAAALLLFLAFCGKENAVAWAPFLLVFGLVRCRIADPQGGWRAAFRRRLPSTLLVSLPPLAVFLLLRHRMIAALPEEPSVLYLVNPLYHEPTATRLLTAIMVWGHGLYKTLLPFSLASDYGAGVFPLITNPLHPAFLVSLLVLLGMLVGGVAVARRHPLLFLGMACFLGFSFLITNIPLAIGTTFGERLYYTPSLGMSFLVAWLVVTVRSRPKTAKLAGFEVAKHAITGVIVFALWLSVSVAVIWSRNGVWKNNRELFLNDVVVQPNSARLHRNASGFVGSPAERKAHLERAVELFPGYASVWNDLATLHVAERNIAKAEESLRKGLASPWRDEAAYELHYNLGVVLLNTGRVDEAKREFEAALGLRPARFAAKLGEFVNLLRDAQGRRRFRVDYSWLISLLEHGEQLLPGRAPWALSRGQIAYEVGEYARAARELAHSPALRQREPWLFRWRYAYVDSLARTGKTKEALTVGRGILADQQLLPEDRTKLVQLLNTLEKR